MNDQLVADNKLVGGNVSPGSVVSDKATAEYPINLMHNVTVYGGGHIGKYSYFNVGTVVYSNVNIGRYCSIGRSCEIGAASHPTDWLSSHPFQFDKTIFKNNPAYCEIKKLKRVAHTQTNIGNDVWIGAKALITDGVTIGDGAVIAGGSVVAKDVEPYSIVGGVPAKHIRYRFEESIVQELMNIKWWDLPTASLNDINFSNINEAIASLKIIRANQNAQTV